MKIISRLLRGVLLLISFLALLISLLFLGLEWLEWPRYLDLDVIPRISEEESFDWTSTERTRWVWESGGVQYIIRKTGRVDARDFPSRQSVINSFNAQMEQIGWFKLSPQETDPCIHRFYEDDFFASDDIEIIAYQSNKSVHPSHAQETACLAVWPFSDAEKFEGFNIVFSTFLYTALTTITND